MVDVRTIDLMLDSPIVIYFPFPEEMSEALNGAFIMWLEACWAHVPEAEACNSIWFLFCHFAKLYCKESSLFRFPGFLLVTVVRYC